MTPDTPPAPIDTRIPLGPHNATHYGKGWKGYEFFAPDGRRDGIPGPRGLCFCGEGRPFTGGGSSCTVWCKCGIEWSCTWGVLTWVDRRRHVARPDGVVA